MKNNSKTAAAGSAAKSNLVKKLTLEVLNERHNALARLIGIPCVVEASAVLSGAPSAEGCLKKSKSFACYRVDLLPFKGNFSKVRFRAASNGGNVVFGYIVDKSGNVECVAEAKKPDTGTITMPLTTESKALYAAMPAHAGKPVWENVKVDLLCDGIITEVADAMHTLHSQIMDLERRVAAAFAANPFAADAAATC